MRSPRDRADVLPGELDVVIQPLEHGPSVTLGSRLHALT